MEEVNKYKEYDVFWFYERFLEKINEMELFLDFKRKVKQFTQEQKNKIYFLSIKSNLFKITYYAIDVGADVNYLRFEVFKHCVKNKQHDVIKLLLLNNVKIPGVKIKSPQNEICFNLNENFQVSNVEVIVVYKKKRLMKYLKKYFSDYFDVFTKETEKINLRNDTCPISLEKIKKKDKKICCSQCKNVFLRDYLAEWIIKNINCPVCRSSKKYIILNKT